MEVRYSYHAIVDEMPDDKISKEEVETVIRKAEQRTRIAGNKYKFKYRDIEIICIKTTYGWFIVTAWRN
jgi:hypothetical protein